jgi:superfamily II DNA or RNA helicase
LRIAREALLKQKRVTFVCDRTALINQTSATADRYGLTDHAIIQANHPRRDNSMPFQIASVQTLGARGYWPQSDIIIIDECHTTHSAWVDYVKQTEAAVIGLTATPFTKGLGLIFGNVVNAATMDELTRLKVLVPLEIQDCVSPDMVGAATSGGEWTLKAASERELKIVGDVVPEWLKHGDNEKTIAFGPDIAYCTQLMQRFTEAGIGAALYTCETPDRERAELLSEFSKPDPSIRVLISVEALAKGFDVPDIGCVIDARPLRKSFSTVIQMIGRGLRSSPDTGKTRCKLLSFSGNIRRFYDDFVELYYNGCGELSAAEKLDAAPRKEPEEFESAGCPECHHKPFRRHCLSCGFEKSTLALVDSTAGVMQEVRIGKKKLADSKADMWNQICTYAKTCVRGKQSGWAFYKYQDITGERPPRSFPSFDDAPMVAISAATAGKLRSMRIAYHKAKEARV